MNKEKGEETKIKERFYAKKSEIRSVFYTNKPMFVLVYKETLLNINDLGSSLPSIVSSSLQAFEDGLCGLPPFKGIEHQIDLVLELQFKINLLIRLIPRKQRSFNAKWRN